MKLITTFIIVLLTLIPNLCLSETNARHNFPNTLYSKEKIIDLSDKLQLTEDQKEKINALSTQYVSESTYLSNKLKFLSDKFAKILERSKVNRIEASLMLDEISAVEKIQKERTILYLIDLKNLLTEKQQEILSGSSN